MLGVASEVKAYSPHILREKTKVPEEHENTNKLYYGTWQEIDPHICLRQDNIKKKKCGGPEIWLQLCWRCQSVSRLKKKKKKKTREALVLWHVNS